jgi:hypothetical protein
MQCSAAGGGAMLTDLMSIILITSLNADLDIVQQWRQELLDHCAMLISFDPSNKAVAKSTIQNH